MRVSATGLVPSLVGTMVIDVVEGTAMASLKHMHAILAKRPAGFRSYRDAIQWSLQSGTIRNSDAAQVSIPSQLVRSDDGALVWRTDLASSAKYWRGTFACVVLGVVWHLGSFPVGADWFIGLSEQFLALPVAKILVLAGS